MKELIKNCWQIFGTVNLSMSQLPITREHLVKSQWSIFTFEYAEEFRLTCSLILVLPAVRAALFKFIARSRGTTLWKITIAADANKGKQSDLFDKFQSILGSEKTCRPLHVVVKLADRSSLGVKKA